MRVFRGPAQKDFQDKSHEKVATVGATELRNAIEKNSYFTFNITKAEDCERQSVCSADFDDTDICFIMVAASKKLRIYSNAIKTIDKILKIEATSEKKIQKIKKICEGIEENGEIPDVGIDLFGNPKKNY